MSHSDDKGLVLPPALAPIHVVIVPIGKTDEDVAAVLQSVKPMIDALKQSTLQVSSKYFGSQGISLNIKIDADTAKTM